MSKISKTCQDAAENGTVVGVLKTKTLQGKKLKVKFEFLCVLGHFDELEDFSWFYFCYIFY